MDLSNCRKEDHSRNHNDVLAYVGHAGTELVQKTIQSIMGYPTFNLQN